MLHRPAALLLVLLLPALASCGGDDEPKPVATAATTASSVTTSATSPRQTSKPAVTPGIGESYRIDPLDGGRVNVTLTRVVDPMALEPFEKRLFGAGRFIAIRLTFDNYGTKTYGGGLSMYSSLFASDNRERSPVSFSFTHCRMPSINAPVIPAGRRGVGCIAFKVPANARVRTFRYLPLSLAGEYGPAKWDLRGE